MARSFARQVGRALRPIRPGPQTLTARRRQFRHAPDQIRIESPAFLPDGVLPARFTIDGPGVSPPLSWSELPSGTHSIALLVEDADIPWYRPLTHLIVYDISPDAHGLSEGAIPSKLKGQGEHGLRVGRNGLGRWGWLPPSPPPGHGPHRYAFQVFALDKRPEFDWPPGRKFFLQAIRRHVLAHGTLIGRYAR